VAHCTQEATKGKGRKKEKEEKKRCSWARGNYKQGKTPSKPLLRGGS
jgi:hypothetical protein